jgi:hypothetical protein
LIIFLHVHVLQNHTCSFAPNLGTRWTCSPFNMSSSRSDISKHSKTNKMSSTHQTKTKSKCYFSILMFEIVCWVDVNPLSNAKVVVTLSKCFIYSRVETKNNMSPIVFTDMNNKLIVSMFLFIWHSKQTVSISFRFFFFC